MLDSCLYHLLDQLLPPLRTCGEGNKGDFLRLEYLSACKIMEDVTTSERLLPHVPPTLFPALFQAIAQRQFNAWLRTSGQPHSASTLSLTSLLKYWPNDTMIVRDFMQHLQFHVPSQRAHRMTLKNILNTYDCFYDSFLSILPHTFVSRFSREEEPSGQCSLRILDISGSCSVLPNILSLKNIEDKVKKAYKPNCPSNYNGGVLVTDTQVSFDTALSSFASIEALGVICNLSQHHGAHLIVKFRKVCIEEAFPKGIVCIIKLLSQHNATEYLRFEDCLIDESVMEALQAVSGTICGLDFYHSNCNFLLKALEYFPHLNQLDLSGVGLSGNLQALTNLPQGLKFLKLVGCQLKEGDLDVLTNSHHPVSLLHLDISENTFWPVVRMLSLCKLCQRLEEVTVLEVEHCSLERSNDENFKSFIDVLKELPNLRMLNLNANDFYTRVVNSHLHHLAYGKSLQHLCLTIPSDNYLSDDYNVVESQMKKIKLEFSKYIESIPESQLYVEWKEEITYSHWYYSV